jgi:hypothetical protein
VFADKLFRWLVAGYACLWVTRLIA